MSSTSKFVEKLNYLGGNLGLSLKVDHFVDLEVFFLECTTSLGADSRLNQTILHWLYRYARILSPSKIRRLIKGQFHFSSNGLFVLLKVLRENGDLTGNWEILDPFAKKQAETSVLLPKNFIPDESKFLKTPSFVLKGSPEIRYRALGVGHVAADIQAFLEKGEKFQSLYDLAKKIHGQRARVNQCYHDLRRFGVL
jgi:hypothetical protein